MKSALQQRLATDGLEKRTELVNFALDRLSTLRSARDQTFTKLDSFARVAASDFSGRTTPENAPETLRTIFDKSNTSLQVVRSIARFLHARLNKDAFGSAPWFSATPRGPHDKILSGRIQEHASWKLDGAHWKDMGREALKVALDLGWVAIKTTWRTDWDVSESLQTLLVDPNGVPITTETGDYIFPEDDAEEADELPEGAPVIAPPPMMPEGDLDAPALPMEEGMELPPPMILPPPGPRRVFTKAPNVETPDPARNGFSFREHLVENKTRIFSGLHVSTVHWKDVVWPVNAASMSLDDPQCDFISHTYDSTVEQLRSEYDPDGNDSDVQELLEKCANGNQSPKANAGKPVSGRMEAEVNGNDTMNPPVKVTECYFRKCMKPGQQSRIYMVLLEDERTPIYVEYLSEMTPFGEAPVHLVAFNKVPGRAWGIGLYEMFEMPAEAIDTLVNGILYRNEYHVNPIKAANTDGLELDVDGEPLAVGPGQWLKLNSKGLPLSQVFQFIALPDLDQRSWQLLELLMQLIQVESGVTNASQGDVSDLPSNGTATGVNSLLESSSVLHHLPLEEARSGLARSLSYAVELMYFKQDTDETYAYQAQSPPDELAGQQELAADPGAPASDASAGTMTLSQAQTLSQMRMNVEILLTRAKQQEMRSMLFAAIQQAQQFFSLPPAVQLKLQPLYVEAIRAVGYDSSEEIFPTVAELQTSIQQAAQQPPPGPPVQERINANYKDFPEDVKRQAEGELGFQPSTLPPPESDARSFPRPEAEPPTP